MEKNKLKIPRKQEDHTVFSIRIKNALLQKLDTVSQKTNRSRNEVINICLTYALDNLESDNQDEQL